MNPADSPNNCHLTSDSQRKRGSWSPNVAVRVIPTNQMRTVRVTSQIDRANEFIYFEIVTPTKL
jgi:hypothetical protein